MSRPRRRARPAPLPPLNVPDLIVATPTGGYIFQGPRPPQGDALEGKVDALVLCAVEHQPEAWRFPGVRVLRARLDDARPSAREWSEARSAARRVADLARRGAKVLVTCNMGLNRSGLVVALALIDLGMTPRQAVALVRERRREVEGLTPLCNHWFVDRLTS